MNILLIFIVSIVLIVSIVFSSYVINCKKTYFKNMNISKIGSDGFGHQLYSIISLIGSHKLRYNLDFNKLLNYYNDNHSYQHIDKKQRIDCNRFIRALIEKIIYKNNFKVVKKYYNKIIKYPKKENISNKNYLYLLDNNYYDLGALENFINNYYNFNDIITLLPKSNYIDKNKYNEIICLHCRFGDSSDRTSDYNEILNLIIKLKKKYLNSLIILHTDGDVHKFNNLDIIVKDKKYPILSVLSDMMNSTILLISNSGLSFCGVWLGKHKLIIKGPSKKKFEHPLKKTGTKIINYKDI